MSDQQLDHQKQQQESTTFNVHAGRNAFRRMSTKARQMSKDLESMDVDELRRQQFAIRSFTESVVDDEWPPADGEEQWERERGGEEQGMMRESSTTDTIIEVSARADPTKGETQKYTMRVPGPEQVDQEMELHRSLISSNREAVEEEDQQEEGVKDGEEGHAAGEATAQQEGADRRRERTWQPRAFPAAATQQMSQHQPAQTIARPRPSTPTGLSFSRLESFCSAEMADTKGSGEQRQADIWATAKMRVVIPKSKIVALHQQQKRLRRFSTGAKDFWAEEEQEGGRRFELTAKSRTRSVSQSAGRHGITQRGDIIESNPEYWGRAPGMPVEHRRQSRDWESFEEWREMPVEQEGEKGQVPLDEGGRREEEAEGEREFTKALEEVRQLIEQKLHSEQPDLAEEGAINKTSERMQNEESPGSPPSTPARLGSVHSPLVNRSQREATFQSPAQFTSTQFAEHSSSTSATAGSLLAREEEPDNRLEDYHLTSVEPRVSASMGECPPAAESTMMSANPFSGITQMEQQAGTEWTMGGQERYGEGQQYGGTAGHYGGWTGGQQEVGQAEQQQYYREQQHYYHQQEQQYGGGAHWQGPEGDWTRTAAAGGEQQQQQQQQQYDHGAGSAYGQQQQEYYYYGAQQQQSEWTATVDPGLLVQHNYGQCGVEGTEAGGENNPFGGAGGGKHLTGQQPQQQQSHGEPWQYNEAFSQQQQWQAQEGQQQGRSSSRPAPSSYESQQQQSTDGYQADTSAYGRPPPPAMPPPSFASTTQFLTQPLLPAQRARTPDPFSWEAQESVMAGTGAGAEHGSAMGAQPSRPPPPMAPPRTPEREEEHWRGVEQEEEEEQREQRAAPPPRPKGPPPVRPPAPSPSRSAAAPQAEEPPKKGAEEEKGKQAAVGREEEEDAWARFQRMTDRVSAAVKSTGERLGKLSGGEGLEDDDLVRDYLAQTGGQQGTQLSASQKQMLAQQEAERKRAKAEKRKRMLEKGLGGLGAAIGGAVGATKRAGSPPADPRREQDLEKAAAELARKIAARHGFKLEGQEDEEEEEKMRTEAEEGKGREEEENERRKQKETEEEEQIVQEEQNLPPPAPAERSWAPLEDVPLLPPSESDLRLAEKLLGASQAPAGNQMIADSSPPVDPFAPPPDSEAAFDPFEVRPLDELIAEARQQAELERARREAAERSGELLPTDGRRSHMSSPTPEGGSPASSARPTAFEDDFGTGKEAAECEETPLYDEDDSRPLPEFPVPFRGDGWELLLRYPPKKKLMTDRHWKPIFVRMRGDTIGMFANAQESRPSQEIQLHASFSLSDTTLQAYDIYGKLHTVKLQQVQYKERVGIRPGQISRLVEGHITKYGLPLEHAAQCTVIAKFGALDSQLMASFTNAVEDVLFRCAAKREGGQPVHRQDEVQMHCCDEYEARVDKEGNVSEQRARVRLFCLAFLSGAPFIEIGLNDRRREGKEVVRRKDILPMYTERWIRFEAPEFHQSVDRAIWEEDQVVRLQPPDGCLFEVMRFRVRPPRNREKPLTVKCLLRTAGSSVEIRIDAMAGAHHQRTRGTTESTRNIPCEDIAIRFPIPEAWIYIFREERHWGVGSVHSKMRKPGRVKNLRDKLMGAVQQQEAALIEVGTGEAKYEHLFRSLVWRIPRLPDKQSAVFKCYQLKCRFQLSSFDLMPATFEPRCELEFTMPLSVISNTVIRSVGVEQHEDSDRVEKFVRYVAKCRYSLEINVVQCTNLDEEPAAETAEFEAAEGEEGHPAEQSTNKHMAAFDPNQVQIQHEGYRIELPEDRPNGAGRAAESSSSSSEDEGPGQRRAFPVIQIDMKGYGYD